MAWASSHWLALRTQPKEQRTFTVDLEHLVRKLFLSPLTDMIISLIVVVVMNHKLTMVFFDQMP